MATEEETAETLPLVRPPPFSVLKGDPGRVGLKSVLHDLDTLRQLEALHLPAPLETLLPPHLVRRYRLRVAAEPPREVRQHPEPLRYTLLAAFCWQRRHEIIDGLVDLLIQIGHRITVRAEKKVVQELLGDLQKVRGKTTLLFQMAEAAVDHPDGTVRHVLYPIVSAQRLRDLVKDYRGSGTAYRQQVYTILRASYSGHYRRMLPPLLETLAFRTTSAAYQPIITALERLKAQRDSRQRYWAVDGSLPIHGVIPPQWLDLVIEPDGKGGTRVNRMNYEMSALHALREALRCKAIWVVGAQRFRNPDEDLPQDFEARRPQYYAALQQPERAEDFTARLPQTMEAALTQLNAGLPRNPKVSLRAQGPNVMKVSPLAPQPEPPNVGRLTAELMRRWPMTSL